MQETYSICYEIALHYAQSVLPEGMWEDCACDFRLLMRERVESDEWFRLWVRKSDRLISHIARYYVLDCARKLGRHLEISTSEPIDSSGTPMEWEFPDLRNLPGEALNHEAFWQRIARISTRLPKRSIEILLLCFRDGYSHAEIAAATGLSVNAVSLILSRALRSIACACEDQGITRGDLAAYFSPPPSRHLYPNRGSWRRRWPIAKKSLRKHWIHDRFCIRESVYKWIGRLVAFHYNKGGCFGTN